MSFLRAPNTNGVSISLDAGRSNTYLIHREGAAVGHIELCGNGYYAKLTTERGTVDYWRGDYDRVARWVLRETQRATASPREVSLTDAEDGPQPQEIPQPGRTHATFDARGRLRTGREELTPPNTNNIFRWPRCGHLTTKAR
jgi:hypothetical protein